LNASDEGAAQKSAKGKQTAIGCGVLLLVVVVIAVLISVASGGSSKEATQPALQPVPAQQGAAGADNPSGQKAEAALLGQLQRAGIPITKQTTIQAYALCVVLGQGTTDADAAVQVQQIAGLSSSEATTFVDAARPQHNGLPAFGLMTAVMARRSGHLRGQLLRVRCQGLEPPNPLVTCRMIRMAYRADPLEFSGTLSNERSCPAIRL
jgi:hypothetical protein